MQLKRLLDRTWILRITLVAVLAVLEFSAPPARTTASSVAASSLPLTTSGVHFGMLFNSAEPTVNGYKTQEGNVDYVYSADGGMHNVPADSGHPWHDKYLSWSRDAAAGASEPISWYQQYHPDWLLYKADRRTIPVVWGDDVAPLDFTNPAVQQYIVNTWINPALAGGFQGVVFDNDLGFNYLGAAGHYDASGTWVQQYTGNWSDATYAEAQVTAFQQLVALVHASHPTATVGINQGVDCNNDLSLNEAGQQYADIITDEEGFTNSANTSLPYVAQYANGICPNGKWLTVMQWAQHLGRDLGEGLFIVNPEPYSVTAYMTDTNRQARFDLQWSLANYLLIKYAHTYFRWGGHTEGYGYPVVPQHEYQTVQAIGSPTDDFYASQQVYMRDFTNGLAVVNPSRTTAYTVSVPAGKYQDLYGTPITTVSLPAHSGLVLLLAHGASVPPSSAPTESETPAVVPTDTPTATRTVRSPTPTRTRTVRSPSPTPTPSPTWTAVPRPSTPFPTATGTATPSRPAPTRTPARTLRIDKVQVLHLVHGHLRETRVLYFGEKARFLVMYRSSPGLRKPTATLLLTHHGRTVRRIHLRSTLVDGHPAFITTLVVSKALAGKVWSHFELVSGHLYTKRDRKVTVIARRSSK